LVGAVGAVIALPIAATKLATALPPFDSNVIV